MCLGCTWIGALLVDERLALVLHEVLHVAHLVVDSEQLVHVGACALLDPAQ